MDNKVYFTLTGTRFYHGKDFLKKDMTVRLVKEPDNACDKEAIRVELEGLGKIGYVANSPYTVIGESVSAGRLYDRFDDEADGKIIYVIPTGVLCSMT